jgi:Tol biopolymer transport system component
MKRWTTTTVMAAALGLVAAGFTGPAMAGNAHGARADGQTYRVSVSSRGAQANGESSGSAISRDGRYAAFRSSATNLVPGDTNKADDVFVRDRRTGRTTRVSVTGTGAQARGGSSEPSISADGRYVAFMSAARNLPCGRPARPRGIFVHDRRTGTTTCVSVSSTGAGPGPNDHSGQPSISAGGRYVTFYSDAANLVPGDTNHVSDVFVHDRLTRKTTRADLSDHDAQLGSDTWQPSISGDGRYVAFESEAGNATPDDRNGISDVFVRDRVAHTTTRVSVWPGGLEGNDWSGRPSISADGRYVAFYTAATNVVPGDTTVGRAFVWDRVTGTPRDLGPATADATLSADGRYVAFTSSGPDLVPARSRGVFVRDLHSGRDSAVYGVPRTVSGWYTEPRISTDGRHVAFASAVRFTAGDTNRAVDAFVHDLDAPPGPPVPPAPPGPPGSTERLSVSSTGAQASGALHPAISADGAVVAFRSSGDDLVPDGTPPDVSDVFIRDRRTATTSRVDAAGQSAEGNGYLDTFAISGNGQHVAFTFAASTPTPPPDGTGHWNVYVHDRGTGTTTRISVSATDAPVDGGSFVGAISADGRYVAFGSDATNLVPGGTTVGSHVYVHDRQTATTDRVDLAGDGDRTKGGGTLLAMTPDGRYVAFYSTAADLVPGDTNGRADVFLRDRQAGTTERVGMTATGGPVDLVYGASVAISADARYLAFSTESANVVPGDTNRRADVFVRDRRARTTQRVSVATGGTQADKDSSGVSMSADGRRVGFSSESARLVRGDTNGRLDMFVRDRRSGTTTRVSLADNGAQAIGASGGVLSADGRWVALDSLAPNLVPDDTNGEGDIFLRRLGP